MPTFYGDVKEWNTFSNLFHEAIHIRDIPDSEKMYRLKAVVKGEAGRLIQHMNVSEANYKTAWEMLQKRYNNRRWLFRTQVDQLLDQPSTTVGDAKSIRQLTDTTNECINTIKGMESLQNLDEVQTFLEHQFQALDAMKNKETDDRKINYPKKICAYCNKAGHTTNDSRKFSAMSNFERRLPVNQQINTSINFNCSFCRKQGYKIYSCSSFSSLPISNKRAFLNANDTCKICLSHKNQDKCISKYTCKICNSRDHHTLLHNEHQQEKKDKSTKTKVIAVTKKDESEVVLLPTAIVKGNTIRGEYKELHALIDQGSQASVISEEAVNILGLQKVKTDIKLTGLAETSVGQANSKVIMEIKSKINNINMKEEFIVMNKLIRPLPEKTIDHNKNQWKSYNLADPEFMKTKQIDLIIGSDIIPKIIKKGFKKINGIIAQETIFGWIISGKVLKKPAKRSKVTITTKNIEKFWELEEANNTINEKTAEDEICMQFYDDTTKIDGDKKFIVKLPLKKDATLDESRNQAMARFLNQEKKMSNEKRTEYIKFMQEYEQKGHMEKVKDNTIGKYYLPHQAVIRESSRTTKLRVVFDASAKSTNGKSLNDIMMTGPRLQQDIFDILMKWRLWKFVASADVEKMFRQIKIAREDQDYQRILWRENAREKIMEYRLTTVTYGTAAAPFLAVYLPQNILYTTLYPKMIPGGFHNISGRRVPKELQILLSFGPKYSPIKVPNINDYFVALNSYNEIHQEQCIILDYQSPLEMQKHFSQFLEIMTKYQKSNRTHQILFQMYAYASEYIKKQKDLIIVQADKGHSTCLMKKIDYIRKMNIWIDQN
ncbi:uncharacterized protein LOC119688851 [Teleopsis dalmanni]|uniref:uncharacterized protein LOC119688851 n=1 Tax=Teleopsis dalmanni TaxID=139649 RepID=UPI0018CCCCAB|nr:uncharacterized protein LOC119688851 [Teleopsis dalmanni]